MRKQWKYYMAKSKVITRQMAKEQIEHYFGELTELDTDDFCRYLLECTISKATPKQLEQLYSDIAFYIEDADTFRPIKVLKDTKAVKILLTKR